MTYSSNLAQEAATEPLVWTALAWGGRRDLALIAKLKDSRSLRALVDKGEAICRKGLVRASRQHRHNQTLDRRILKQPDFPKSTFLWLDADSLPLNRDPFTHRMTDLSAFELPQLVVKKSWIAESGRFQSAITREKASPHGVLCTQSYVSVSIPDDISRQLESACLSFNSILAVYYFLLTSGRLARTGRSRSYLNS